MTLNINSMGKAKLTFGRGKTVIPPYAVRMSSAVLKSLLRPVSLRWCCLWQRDSTNLTCFPRMSWVFVTSQRFPVRGWKHLHLFCTGLF